jgi:hypothetical protein
MNMAYPLVEKISVGANTDDIFKIIDRDGAVIISGLLDDQEVEQLTTELNPVFEDASFCDGLYFGQSTKRIHSLVAKSKSFRKLAIHSAAINLANRILGPYCEKIQMNASQGIQIWPGAAEQILHRDDAKFPTQYFDCEFMTNMIVACTKFTRENGCTRFALGSHKWEDKSRRAIETEISYAEMEPGDAVFFVGSVIHSGGANCSSKPRTGVVMGYSLGWLRQTENQYLVAPPEIAKDFPEALQDLLGYAVHRPNLGMYEGNEPKALLQSTPNKKLITHDWLTPAQNERVRSHYVRCTG